jgi:hypothetical protein
MANPTIVTGGDPTALPKITEAPDLRLDQEVTLRGWTFRVAGLVTLQETDEFDRPVIAYALVPIKPFSGFISPEVAI